MTSEASHAAARGQPGGDARHAPMIVRAATPADFPTCLELNAPYVACEIDVDPPNPASQRFHAKFHFQEIGRQLVAGGRKMVSLQLAAAVSH